MKDQQIKKRNKKQKAHKNPQLNNNFTNNNMSKNPIGRAHLKLTPPKGLSPQQDNLLEILDKNQIIFILGSAGCGKTYLSVKYAMYEWSKNKYEKLHITRPLNVVGVQIGFLPGTEREKCKNSYIPIYDVLQDQMSQQIIQKAIESKQICETNVQWCRGRSIRGIWLVDESQNFNKQQMRLILTRLANSKTGKKSKLIITGDLNQVDRVFYGNQKNGLKDAIERLKDVKGVAVVHLSNDCIVRSDIVKRIQQAYQKDDIQHKDYNLELKQKSIKNKKVSEEKIQRGQFPKTFDERFSDNNDIR